jgi:hypothetical protein
MRAEMAKQIDDFIAHGGEVSRIPNGISGRVSNDGAFRNNSTVFEPRAAERTFIPEVVAALEERSKQLKAPLAAKKRQTKPKKIPIYDDFGEILRWEWRD